MAGARTCALLTSILAAGTLVSCGSSNDQETLKVSAASSLKKAITEISAVYGNSSVHLEFAGSDTIATAIRSGRRPDAFLAASVKIPTELAAENLVDNPVVFARNRVVIAVLTGDPAIKSIADLGQPGVKLAIGSPSVPIGSYADKIFTALPPATRAKVKANIKTREPDAASLSAKVTSGTVDAAILYETDVKAANGKLKGIGIPVALGSLTKCAAAVVKGTGNEKAAAKFIANLLTPKSQATLARYGFLPVQAGP